MSQPDRKFWTVPTTLFVIFAVPNAISYFIRSNRGGFLQILDSRWFPFTVGPESIGFPFVIWHAVNSGPYHFHFSSLVYDIAIAAACAVGAYYYWFHKPNSCPGEKRTLPSTATDDMRPFQFSLKTLMIVTAAVALALSLNRSGVIRSERVVWLIYILGPASLFLIAHCSRRMIPRHRAALMWATAILLIIACGLAGWDSWLKLMHRVALTTQVTLSGYLAMMLMRLFACWVLGYVIVKGAIHVARAISELPTGAPED